MSASAQATEPNLRSIRNLRWWIGALLFASTVINYIDRQTLSLLSPYLKELYRWTNSDYANLLIGFRIAYSIGQCVCGRLMDRVGTRRGLTLSVLWYSIVSMATALAGGFYSFATFRFLLGGGGSANWRSGCTLHRIRNLQPLGLASGVCNSRSAGFRLAADLASRIPPAQGSPTRERRRATNYSRGCGRYRCPARKASFQMDRPFEASADVGSDCCEIVHRPRLVLHCRLVSDLSGGERDSAQERIDCNLDPLHRRRSRQFLWGSDLRISHPARLDTGRSP